MSDHHEFSSEMQSHPHVVAALGARQQPQSQSVKFTASRDLSIYINGEPLKITPGHRLTAVPGEHGWDIRIEKDN